jgi:murein DD-endopeptidase MepM/ murein hydrolase activator NlpD
LSGGFLLAIIAAVLLIVIAVPEYAEPARGSTESAPAVALDRSSAAPSDAPEALPTPTSPLPTKLKRYRWPVKGGQVADYYDWHPKGRFLIDEKRVHGGLVFTWFDGALVKAAHKGTVVAAGRDWEQYVGYDGDLDTYYQRLKRRKQKPSLGVVIDDGNGYRSVYSEMKDLKVKRGDKVKPGMVIGAMTVTDKRYMMRYQLVRMDGDLLKVAGDARRMGYPGYVREHVDPLAVLRLDANKKPRTDRPSPPSDPPRLSQY